MVKYIKFVYILLGLSLFSTIGWCQNASLTLEQCVTMALENNPDLMMGKFSKKISSRDVAVAFTRFFPNISASMEYFHLYNSPTSKMRIDASTGIPVQAQPNAQKSWNSEVGVNASLMLFDGGYNLSNYKRSQYLRDQAQSDFLNTRQEIIYLVKERYYNVLKSEKLLEAAKQTVRSSRESFRDASTRNQIGDAPRTDVLRANVQLKRDELEVLKAQNVLTIDRAGLNQVLGLGIDQEIHVVDDLSRPETVSSMPSALKAALQFHPRLKREEFSLKAAKAGVNMAVGQLVPQLSARGGYRWKHQDFNQVTHLFEKDYYWYTQISLSIPISQEVTNTLLLSQAKLRRSSAEEMLRRTRQEISLEIQQAFFIVEQAQKQIAVTAEGVDLAVEDLRLNREQYKLGAGSILSLITAQVAHNTAQSDYIQALYDYKFAAARLERAMGILEK